MERPPTVAPGDPASRLGPRLARWLPFGLVGIAVLMRLPTLTLPLLERHSFRQTQTAFTARIFHTDGIDLFHPQLPVFGPPWQVPFEFPLYQAGAALLMDLGVEETVALRGLSLALFALSAVLLHLLLAPRIGRVGATVALVVFLFTPLGTVWSRTSMIEYQAVAASLGFALAGLSWRERGGWRWWALAATLGSIAMLVKITSAVFWIVPFALLGFARDRDVGGVLGGGGAAHGSWRSPAAWGLVVVPLAIGLLWTRHADAIKGASEATAWLTSSALFEWNFGTIAQRLDPDAWARALRPSTELTAMDLLPYAALITSWFAIRSGQWRFWAWVGLAYAAPLAIFFNLYVVHDYYSAAIAPAAAAIVGGGAAALARVVRPGGGWRAVAASGALTLAAILFVGNLAGRWSYAAPIFGDPPIDVALLGLAGQIEAETDPAQPVAIIERDWDPTLLFYADRRGFMVRGSTFAPGQLERFLAEGYAVYRCPETGQNAGTCRRITTASE